MAKPRICPAGTCGKEIPVTRHTCSKACDDWIRRFDKDMFFAASRNMFLKMPVYKSESRA
jgi:predicted nucleic acid-binding Zn ribbon protein